MVAVSLKKKNFFQAEDGIRDVERSRGLGDVYKRQTLFLEPFNLLDPFDFLICCSPSRALLNDTQHNFISTSGDRNPSVRPDGSFEHFFNFGKCSD